MYIVVNVYMCKTLDIGGLIVALAKKHRTTIKFIDGGLERELFQSEAPKHVRFIDNLNF